MMENVPGMTFEQTELEFYSEHFEDGLRAKNERYIKNRHPERVRTTADIYRNKMTCPEESIFQIGSQADGMISPEKLLEVYKDFSEWRAETFPNVHLLDYALHTDEQGSPHIHERLVYVGHDADGHEIPSQNKAFKEMGVDRPYPDKPQGRYNNPKQLYSKICREHAFGFCKAHGLEVETAPKEASDWGLSLTEYKNRREESRLRDTERQIEELERQLERKRQQVKDVKAALDDLHIAEKNLSSFIQPAERRMLEINRRREDKARAQYWDAELER